MQVCRKKIENSVIFALQRAATKDGTTASELQLREMSKKQLKWSFKKKRVTYTVLINNQSNSHLINLPDKSKRNSGTSVYALVTFSRSLRVLESYASSIKCCGKPPS